MNIPIYEEPLGPISGSTPFAFYDNDTIFQSDGPKFAKWVSRRLGWPTMNVELQSGSIYTAFEEAINTYGSELFQAKIKENYLLMEGNSTASAFNNQLITPNLGTIIRIAKAYGNEAGSGGNVPWYKGSINLIPGVQDYDLNEWAAASASLQPGDNIEIKRVFHERPPAIVRYFDPYAGTGTGLQQLLEVFGFGNLSPGINFLLMPLYFDLQKLQSIELNDEIRRSAFSFEMKNNVLRIFPIPGDIVTEMPLFFEYIKVSERDNIFKNTSASGSANTGIVTNPSQVPYQNIVYSQINNPGKQWIYNYGLAIVKEMLGYVRKKYENIPIPGDVVQLNGSQLITDAQQEKDKLLEQLRAILDATSRKTQLENKAAEADSVQKELSAVPTYIYIG
ncbi:MAG TPA: hypothetical protein VFV86_07295, partial [Nitrososphaeraceae archaeon]|nr:hypothetical protein [Nitrososphaeraceae archaeon]